jgi:hypothetical protein
MFKYWLEVTPSGRLLFVTCNTPKLLPFELQVFPPDSACEAPPHEQELLFSASLA